MKRNTLKSELRHKIIFHDAREKITLENADWLEIINDEITSAQEKTNKNKTVGTDIIVSEIISVLDDFSINKVTKVTSDILHWPCNGGHH